MTYDYSPKHIERLTRAVQQLQAAQGGFTGPSPSSFTGVLSGAATNTDSFNGVTSMLYLEPNASTGVAGAITVKRTESTWGVSAGPPTYGQAQPFEILSPSTTAASDESTDGHSSGGVSTGTNPVLCRIDAFGGIGTVQGVHVAPGLRDTYGGGTPIGLWVQLSGVDTYGVAVTGPDPTYVPTPFSTLFSTAKFDGTTKYVTIDANGDLNSYNTSGTGGSQKKTATLYHGSTTPGFLTTFADDGSTGVAALYAGNTPALGYRAILAAQTPATRVLALKSAASQTAALQANLASDGTTLLSVVDANGDFVTYDDAGTTGVGALYAGSTPPIGIRALFAAGAPSTTVLALKQGASQTADLMATYNSSGTKIRTIINSAGNISLLASDITALGGALTPPGGAAGKVLAKVDGTDFNYTWSSTIIPAGGTTGQVLTKNSATNYDVGWGSGSGGGGVTSWNTRTGAVTMSKSDVTGTSGLLATAGGIPGIDAANRITIPAGVSAPATTAGGTALGLSAVVGWVGFNIGGTIIKVPAFQ